MQGIIEETATKPEYEEDTYSAPKPVGILRAKDPEMVIAREDIHGYRKSIERAWRYNDAAQRQSLPE